MIKILIRNSKFQILKLNPRRGFSLIEVLVVVGIAALIAASGYVLGIGSYQRYVLSTERDLVVSILQRSRSQALANIGQEAHGLKIRDDSFVLFTVGDSDADVVIPASDTIVYEGVDEIVFDQLSGNAEKSGTITLIGQRGGVDTLKVTVDANGRIEW